MIPTLTFRFIRTTAINKLLRLRKRIRVVPGGTSASKTFGILAILIDTAIKNPGLEISVVSESIPHLRRGALKDFLKIMKMTGRYIDSNYNKTLLTYTFSNGSYIEFFSADQEDKVRGARRNILYLNEANNLNFDTYHQLAIRTDMQVWLDFNPTYSFWAHEELSNDTDAEWLTLTYKDNEALSPTIIAEIEKARDKAYFNPRLTGKKLDHKLNIRNKYWWNWWRVYGLGLTGTLEGIIFPNFEIIANVPSEAKLLGRGLDFGFTNDPTAAIELYRWNSKTIYHQIIYETGLLNSDIAKRLKAANRTRAGLVVADSAEPKSIAEIKRAGVRIKPVSKGQDSIKFGLNLMQEYDIMVTQSSLDLITELRKYSWDTDRNGNYLNVPIDNFNHGIDAGRYIAMETLTKRRKGVTIRANRS